MEEIGREAREPALMEARSPGDFNGGSYNEPTFHILRGYGIHLEFILSSENVNLEATTLLVLKKIGNKIIRIPVPEVKMKIQMFTRTSKC